MNKGTPRRSTLIASATVKADEFAIKNDVPGRARAKQAILEELNSQMQIRAEKIRLEGTTSESYSPGQDSSHRSDATVDVSSGKTVSSRKSNVTAQPRKKRRYDPSYTWNRGGRVKELRIRTIARKFLMIWKRQTFGRVTPSTARSLYERTLVKKCFEEWNAEWWTARKEWGLSVRADLHNRYRLWNKVWSAWREYTVVHRVKSAQKKIADRHANGILLKRLIQNWRRYIEIRRTKKALANQADDVYSNNLIRHAWFKWQVELEVRNHQHEQEMTALEVWAHNLQSKAWTIWYNQWLLKKQERHKEGHAILVAHENLQSRCLKAWITYVKERQRKNKLKALADKARRNFLLERFMNQWALRWEECHTLRVHKQRITFLARSSRSRRVMEHWKIYVSNRKEERLMEAFAVEQYHSKLMRTCLCGLKLSVVQANLKAMRYATAEEHYESSLLKRGWASWVGRMDEREEFWMTDLTLRAKQHYRNVTLKKYLTKWQSYNKWRNHRKNQYVTADAHHYMTVMPQFLNKWYEFVELQIRKRELNSIAANFMKENLEGKYFYEWKLAYHASQDHRMMERMAILHHNDLMMKGTFQKWKVRTEEAVQMSIKQDVASEHCHEKTLRKYFQHWVGFVHSARKTYENEHLAARHHYLKQLRTAWILWTNYTDRRRLKLAQYELADRHCKQVLLLRTLVAWKHYNRWMKEVHQIVQTKWTVKCQQFEQKYMVLWKVHVAESKESKKKELLAIHHRNEVLKQKMLRQWHSYTIYRANKVFEKEQQLHVAKEKLDKVKMLCSFKMWKQRSDESVLDNMKMAKADNHYQSVVYRKSMNKWQGFKSLSLREKLLNRQCMWFHNTRITARYFYQWKVSLNLHREIMNKTYSALWHWSLTVQRKIFINWFYYTQERKRKKDRYNEAMEKHRMFLLRQGSTKWLTVAGDMTAIREKVAANQGAEYAYKTWQVVQKCAHHWRLWAAKKRSQRPFTRSALSEISAVPKPKATEIPQPKAIHQMVEAVKCPAVSKVSPAKSISCRSKIQETQTGRRYEQIYRPKPKMPSFLVDSLKRDGLYTSSGSQEHPIFLKTGAFSGTLNGQETRDGSLNFDSVFESHRTHTKSDVTEDHPTTSSQCEKTKEVNLESEKIRNHSKRLRDRKPKSGGSQPLTSYVAVENYQPKELNTQQKACSAQPQATKFATEKAVDKLLPPSAFLLKKDGSPILDGSSLLPNVFRTDSELQQGQATLNENHFFTNTDESLLPPRNFAQKVNPQTYQFVSPAEEIVQIRNALKSFKDLKQKHRQVIEQEKQLSSWLADQPTESQDPDVIVTRQELKQVQDEVAAFSAMVKTQKRMAQKLTERVKELLPSLSPR